MTNTQKTYAAIIALTEHIPYNNVDFDIADLQRVDGGFFIYGVQKYETIMFLYRMCPRNCAWRFEDITNLWQSTEWYLGDTNGGQVTALRDREALTILKAWEALVYGE